MVDRRTETATTITDLLKVEAQLAEPKARLLTHAEAVDVPSLTAASSTATWLAHTTRLTHTQAHRATRLAQALASPRAGASHIGHRCRPQR